ncbi:unnamed protein product [Symbiodinium microadriaticum]|nr:unnamed protein product [Symbiodinium microadriaticum]
MQPQSRTQSPKCESLSSETLDLRAGFVASLCLIRAHLSWALRDVSSELEHDVLVVTGFAQEGLSKRSRNVSQAATSIGVGSHPPEPASRTALHTEPALDSKDGSTTCGLDKSGYSSGCKTAGCTCSVFQHCYPKFEKEAPMHKSHHVSKGLDLKDPANGIGMLLRKADTSFQISGRGWLNLKNHADSLPEE